MGIRNSAGIRLIRKVPIPTAVSVLASPKSKFDSGQRLLSSDLGSMLGDSGKLDKLGRGSLTLASKHNQSNKALTHQFAEGYLNQFLAVKIKERVARGLIAVLRELELGGGRRYSNEFETLYLNRSESNQLILSFSDSDTRRVTEARVTYSENTGFSFTCRDYGGAALLMGILKLLEK